MNITGSVETGRRWALSTLTGHVTITRQTGSTVDDNGSEVPEWETVYEGAALTQTENREAASADSAGIDVPLQSLVGKVPYGTPVRVGDRWTSDDLTAVVLSVSRNDWGILTRCELSQDAAQIGG